MKVKYIESSEVVETIGLAGDTFFSVTFVKRGDNSLRHMNCRRGVKKGIKGTRRRTSRTTGLMSVYDMVEKGFRTVNLSGVRKIRISGTEYRVKA
jgi:hypothetical protein